MYGADPKEVERLNKRLADNYGRSPLEFGSLPLMAWKWSGDLTYLGLNESTGFYETERQMGLDELGGQERWVTARWVHQGPKAIWEQTLGKAIAWPDQGLYISDNGMWLRIGERPDDRSTELVIEILKHNRDKMTAADKLEFHAEQRKKAAASTASMISDVIDDIPDHNPGRQGQHKSYPLVKLGSHKAALL